jgi:hypothetical protein
MRLSNAQRELALELLHGVGAQLPALLEAWQEAGEKKPPPDVKDDQLFTTIRRLPCDMKPEDGPYRFSAPPPFAGAKPNRVEYFYEPAQPPRFPTVLVVATWSVPAARVVESPTGPEIGE